MNAESKHILAGRGSPGATPGDRLSTTIRGKSQIMIVAGAMALGLLPEAAGQSGATLPPPDVGLERSPRLAAGQIAWDRASTETKRTGVRMRSSKSVGDAEVVELAPYVVEGVKTESFDATIEDINGDLEAALQRIEARARRLGYDAIYAARTDTRFFGASTPGTPADTPRISPVTVEYRGGLRGVIGRLFDTRLRWDTRD